MFTQWGVSLEKLTGTCLIKKFSTFIETEGSVLYSQGPAIVIMWRITIMYICFRIFTSVNKHAINEDHYLLGCYAVTELISSAHSAVCAPPCVVTMCHKSFSSFCHGAPLFPTSSHLTLPVQSHTSSIPSHVGETTGATWQQSLSLEILSWADMCSVLSWNYVSL
jgi:hypothetical protein